jgi:hypothetical protein
VTGASYIGLPLERALVRNVFGGNMSFRREVLLEVGGFRDGLGRAAGRPLGCEETELCIRATARHGGHIVHQPGARIAHKVPAPRATFAYFRARCYGEGLSKAAVADHSEAREALRTERTYVARTLPVGFAHGLRDAVARRDSGGWGRAGAIVAGLAVTTWGYARGRSATALAAVTGARREWAQLLPALVALVLWAFSLRHVDLAAMNDFGLVSVLPVVYWSALALVVVSFPVLVALGARSRVLVPSIVTLLLVVHATPAVLYGAPRYSWTYKHLGIIDYILRHGAVDPSVPNLAAYHSWPGFFALNAFLAQAGGIDPFASARWAPAFFEILLLVPLLLLFRTLTRNHRRVWMAVALFYLANWVGQDYFSPQAFAYFFYLVVIAVCLRWLPARPARRHLPEALAGPLARLVNGRTENLQRDAVSPGQRAALIGLVVLLLAVVTVSHQLTPLMLISTLGLLVVVRRVGPWWLPLAAAGLCVVWAAFAAGPFLEENAYWIVASIGDFASNATDTFVPLGQVPTAQIAVDWADRGLSALVWAAAAVGAGLAWRERRLELVPVVAMLAPVPLLIANDYGGEMLFRVYLFALPFAALLMTRILDLPAAVPARSPAAHRTTSPTPTRPSPWTWATAGAVALSLTLVTPFVLAYYGKERGNYFSPDTLAAGEWLFDHAPSGSLITGPTSNLPWAFTRHEEFGYSWFIDLPADQRRAFATDPLSAVFDDVNAVAGTDDAYVVLTSSQQVEMRYTGAFPDSVWVPLEAAIRASPRFRVAYRSGDATVFQIVKPRARLDESTPDQLPQPSSPDVPGGG